jgi:rhodanese-related sulfurtransferase
VAEIDTLLEVARRRIEPRAVVADIPGLLRDGGLLVDIRPSEQRNRDGELPGALVISRNVLEWRLDPTSPHRSPAVVDAEQPIVLVCDEGYASSLAAATLRDLGLRNATDLDGGFQAWLAAPTGHGPS